MRETKRLIFCPVCTSMGARDFHVCNVYKEGVLVRTTNKRWDARLNCWVLDDNKSVIQKMLEDKKEEDEDVRRWRRYYDVKRNVWVNLDNGSEEPGPPVMDPGKDDKDEGKEGYQTCEIPRKEPHEALCICETCKPYSIKGHRDTCSCWNCWSWKKAKGLTNETWAAYGNPNYGQYVEVKPWDGVDAKKWPNTFMCLMGLYYINNRWYNGLTITSKEYKDRILHKKYAPEPKPYFKKKTEDDDNTYWKHWGDYGED